MYVLRNTNIDKYTYNDTHDLSINKNESNYRWFFVSISTESAISNYLSFKVWISN